jgi:hypothetical protein
MLNLIDSHRGSDHGPGRFGVYKLPVDNFVGMPGWFGAEDQRYQIWMTYAARRTGRRCHAGRHGEQRARLLFRRLDLDVHPCGRPDRRAQPLAGSRHLSAEPGWDQSRGAEFLAKAGAIVIEADNHCLEEVPPLS